MKKKYAGVNLDRALWIARTWQLDPTHYEQQLEQEFSPQELLEIFIPGTGAALREVKPGTEEEKLLKEFSVALRNLYVRIRAVEVQQKKIDEAGQRFEEGLEGLASTLHNRGFTKEASMIRGLL